ncbi:MAG: hypothetical protein WCX70_00735 [Candidatus Paceibacterota bacterium]|jgi:hypothetical protein
MDKKTIFSLIATAILIITVIVYLPFPVGSVRAQSDLENNELRGWAWSDVTGWVSFNNKDYSETNHTYTVKIDNNDNLVGYAWSLNLGWIKFTPGSSFAPAYCNTGDCYGAKIIGDDLKGWARACSVFQNGCSGLLRSESELGGWDGWVRMYNIKRQTNGGFTGYAWGDLNLAWLDFGFGIDAGGGGGGGSGECDPTKQVCGGGREDDENGNEVTVTAASCLDEEGNPTEVTFSPQGDDCDPSGDYCRSYETGETVEVSFSLIPTSVSGCDSYDPEVGICTIESIEEDKNLVAICGVQSIALCQPKLTSITPLKLSESGLVIYPATSNNAPGQLKLVNIANGTPCTGITYNLDSSEYRYVSDATVGPADDSNVSIVCDKDSNNNYTKEECSGLDGNLSYKVKALFDNRPVEKTIKWSLKLMAQDSNTFEFSQSYDELNQLIQYSRPFGD